MAAKHTGWPVASPRTQFVDCKGKRYTVVVTVFVVFLFFHCGARTINIQLCFASDNGHLSSAHTTSSTHSCCYPRATGYHSLAIQSKISKDDHCKKDLLAKMTTRALLLLVPPNCGCSNVLFVTGLVGWLLRGD